MKRLAQGTVIVLATLTFLAILWIFRQVIILFILSLTVAAATRPMIDVLVRRRIHRSLALLLVYLGLFLVFGGLIVLTIRPFFAELENLTDVFARAYDRMWVLWPNGTQLQQAIIQQLPPPKELFEVVTGEQGMAFAQAFIGITSGSFTVLSQFFAIIILSIYWGIDRVHFERLWLSILHVETRARAREIWRDIEDGVGAYLRSEIAQSLLAGLLFGIGFDLIGMPFPVLLAIASSLAWLIPWLGAVLALIPVIIVGFSVSIAMGVMAIGYTVIILLVMELVIEPRIFHRSRFSSLLVIILMIALADALGLIGIVLAPPLAAAIQLLGRHVLLPGPPKTRDESIRKIADLDRQIIAVQDMVAEDLERIPPESLSLLTRLDDLVMNAKKVLEEQEPASDLSSAGSEAHLPT